MAFCNNDAPCGHECARQDDHGGDCDCYQNDCPIRLTRVARGFRMEVLEPPPPSKNVILVNIMRPSWDVIWMNFAEGLALRSTCRRSSVGCVVVSDDNTAVLGLGYNGGPKGLNNDCLSDEPGKCGHLHAEINALIKATYRDAAKKKAYLTLSPCYNCAVALINFGINEVIFKTQYRDPAGIHVLVKAGVKVRLFDQERVPERDLYINKDGKDGDV